MDTVRFDHLSSALTRPGTRRQALRTLAGLAGALAVGATLGSDEGEAKKKGKGKKGKGKRGDKGNKGSGTYDGGQNSGGNTGGNGSGNGGNGDGGSNSSGGGGGSNSGGNNGGGNATQTEEEILWGLINNFRSQDGLPALARNGKLDTAALNHSRDMAARRYFAHNTPEGGTPDQRLTAAGYSFSWWGENIYKSAPGDASAQSAFTSWVNSSGHRANMLSSNFTQIGIGRATDAEGRTLWTNTFGKPA